jgi:Flp pilus assembly pilin Flp
MNQLIRKARLFVTCEEGTAGIEYGVLAALIAVVIIASTGEIGLTLNNTFESIGGQLADALHL